MKLSEIVRSPRVAYENAKYEKEKERYREEGTYEDERDILLFYRDRELELRRAIQARAWNEMRALPGVTNSQPFKSKYTSTLQMRMNIKQITFAMWGSKVSFLGRAAEAEARRRLMLTAISLERHRIEQGAYPKTLNELKTSAASAAAETRGMDFIDGKPLHYRLLEEGDYVLYSIGVDGVNNNGKAFIRNPSGGDPDILGIRNGIDIVWPRAATEAEVEAEDARKQAEEERRKAARRVEPDEEPE